MKRALCFWMSRRRRFAFDKQEKPSHTDHTLVPRFFGPLLLSFLHTHVCARSLFLFPFVSLSVSLFSTVWKISRVRNTRAAKRSALSVSFALIRPVYRIYLGRLCIALEGEKEKERANEIVRETRIIAECKSPAAFRKPREHFPDLRWVRSHLSARRHFSRFRLRASNDKHTSGRSLIYRNYKRAASRITSKAGKFFRRCVRTSHLTCAFLSVSSKRQDLTKFTREINLD